VMWNLKKCSEASERCTERSISHGLLTRAAARFWDPHGVNHLAVRVFRFLCLHTGQLIYYTADSDQIINVLDSLIYKIND